MAKKINKIIKKELSKIGFTDIKEAGYNSSGHPYFTAVNKHNETVKISTLNTPSDHRSMKNLLAKAKKIYNGTYVPRYLCQ